MHKSNANVLKTYLINKLLAFYQICKYFKSYLRINSIISILIVYKYYALCNPIN